MTAVAGVRAHAAKEYVADLGNGVKRRECRVCGEPVEGFGLGLRHVGEAAPVEPGDPKYGETIDRAVAVVRLARPDLGDDAARRIVLALVRDGLMRQRRATPTTG